MQLAEIGRFTKNLIREDVAKHDRPESFVIPSEARLREKRKSRAVEEPVLR